MNRDTAHMARVREAVHSGGQQRMLQTDVPRAEFPWVTLGKFLHLSATSFRSGMNYFDLANL